jgi:hypothetical protein
MPVSTSGLSVPQLSQGIDPSIYGSQNAPKSSSISDMLDISSKTLDLQKQKQTFTPDVQKAQAQADLAQVNLNTAKLENGIKHANIATQNIQQLMTKPDLSQSDIEEMVKKTAKENGGNDQAVQQALMGLNSAKTPSELRAWLAQKLAVSTTTLAQLEKLYPQGILPGQLPANAPSAQAGTNQQNQVGTNQTTQVELPEHSQPIQLPYPVRAAGQSFAPAPSEAADMSAGTEYRNGLVQRQSQLTTDRRNIDEVIKTAHELEKSWIPTSGIMGSAYRHLATWAGDPTYIQLSKDLANTQLSNMKALGLKTDSDKQLTAAANGDYTYPPEVLMNIAARAKADMTNIDMQATAAEKFKNSFGDNNMKKFQQEWSKNADSKIFELINVAKDQELSASEKKKIADSLMGKDSKQRAIFNEKYQNILKLQQTGSL